MKKILLSIICTLAVCVEELKAQTGKFMSFDGVSNFLTVADHDDLDIGIGENYTITCWIRTSQWKNMPVFRKRDASNYGYEMTVGSNGNYSVNVRSTTNINVGPAASLAPHMSLNQWYHLAMVVDVSDRTVKIFRNGELQQSSTNTGIGTLNFETAVDVTIGHSAAQSRYFVGDMDNIRVWNKAFTTADLLTEMTLGSVNSTTPNLLAAWDFENVTGAKVPDVSGNGHTGTISGLVTLPVTFISFTGKVDGSMVQLEWITASEQNNSYFEIERSTNGVNFYSIIKSPVAVSGKYKKAYQAVDYNPSSGTNYYRLKQADLDGKFTYFEKVIAVSVLSGKQSKLQIYPHPANQFTIIKWPMSTRVEFEIYDINGRHYPVTYQKEADRYIINTSLLDRGLYFLKTKSGNEILVDKLIVENAR